MNFAAKSLNYQFSFTGFSLELQVNFHSSFVAKTNLTFFLYKPCPELLPDLVFEIWNDEYYKVDENTDSLSYAERFDYYGGFNTYQAYCSG